MPYFADERPPLANERELRELYATLPTERASAMTDALDALADLETHRDRFPARRMTTALAQHGFAHAYTTPHGVEVWALASSRATYDRAPLMIPDPERDFGDTAICILHALWALAQAADIGLVEAAARVLAATLAPDADASAP